MDPRGASLYVTATGEVRGNEEQEQCRGHGKRVREGGLHLYGDRESYKGHLRHQQVEKGRIHEPTAPEDGSFDTFTLVLHKPGLFDF